MPALGLLAGTRAFGQGVALDPNDPTAKGLAYVVSSPNPQQKCSNCAQYTGAAGAAKGNCVIFPGKEVAAGGYCKAWLKKA